MSYVQTYGMAWTNSRANRARKWAFTVPMITERDQVLRLYCNGTGVALEWQFGEERAPSLATTTMALAPKAITLRRLRIVRPSWALRAPERCKRCPCSVICMSAVALSKIRAPLYL